MYRKYEFPNDLTILWEISINQAIHKQFSKIYISHTLTLRVPPIQVILWRKPTTHLVALFM